ncbi:hypothetical protein M9458_007358, partial [Cirrhinus mrigala]
MALRKDPSLQAELISWCKEAGIDESHALMLINVPAHTDVAAIEEIMEAVKVLGRVRVRDTREGPTSRFLLVLCECKQVIDPTCLPPEVSPGERKEPWTVIAVQARESVPDPASGGFTERLAKFLMEEGKSINDVQALLTLRSTSDSSPESIIRAVGEILEKTIKHPSDTNAYRRLRTFSGVVPTPPGEENMETWIEQARLMITECECSEKEKRRRIVESLKGPALEIIRAVWFSNPEASALQYLEALESTFGSSESGEDMYFKFRLLRQSTGETLSEFLRRIEKMLSKVVERDGLSPLTHMMLLQLRLRERKHHPPSFLNLLKEIREAEESEASRHRMSAKAKAIQYCENERASTSVIQELKAEIQELRTQICGGESKTVSTSSLVIKPKEKQIKPTDKTDSSEILEPRPKTSTSSSSLKGKSARTRDDYFCYRCGEDGHIATKCQAPPNSDQVIQKLIRSLRQAKSEKYETDNHRKAQNQACFSKKSQTDVCESRSLPKGLVGPASTVDVKLNGHVCQALLDTGSQVTIVFDSWFSRNLPDVPIHPLTGLSIWGLSSSSYPYKGYIVVDVTFPASVTGVEESLSILALVCPDPQGPPQVPVIIGTNASFFKRLAALSQGNEGAHVAHALKIQTRQSAIHLPQLRETERLPDKPDGKVRWIGPGDCVIPPRGEIHVTCQMETDKPLRTEIFVVDTTEADSLPAGTFITPVVLPSSAIDGKNIQVLVHNETSKDISIPAGTVVAHVYPTDTLAVPSGGSNSFKVIDPMLFNFSESSIPKAWELRLRQKLSTRGDVFSTGEWDVGLALGVEHHIRLTDTKPFRERSRRIAPADIEDVQRHIKELLAAGIIKESVRLSHNQYTTPRIDDGLDCLAGSKWFSVLDLRSGYYQIAMGEEDKEKTAFICPLGFFQFERMPQGITGAPATFQRLMEKAVGDMHLLQVIVYLDDIIVFGRTLEEHEERLLKVLDRLQECGLKVSIDKCQFCQSQVRYVGHIVSAAGVSPDPAKIEAVTRWKMPTDLKSHSFLGFCGFYRRFIKDYSAI